MRTEETSNTPAPPSWQGTPPAGAVLLLSGGVDSVTLLHWVRETVGVVRVLALSFAYGQRHARELDMARWQVRRLGGIEHRVIDISFLGGLVADGTALTTGGRAVPDLAALTDAQKRQPPTYVPHRNLVLLSLAAAAAEGSGMTDVFYGAQAQDEYGYWDCTPGFVSQLNAVLARNRGQAVRIHAPFVGLSKRDVVKIGLALKVDYTHTWTCYRGAERPCGTCPSCVERQAAFTAAGVPDPLV